MLVRVASSPLRLFASSSSLLGGGGVLTMKPAAGEGAPRSVHQPRLLSSLPWRTQGSPHGAERGDNQHARLVARGNACLLPARCGMRVPGVPANRSV